MFRVSTSLTLPVTPVCCACRVWPDYSLCCVERQSTRACCLSVYDCLLSKACVKGSGQLVVGLLALGQSRSSWSCLCMNVGAVSVWLCINTG